MRKPDRLAFFATDQNIPPLSRSPPLDASPAPNFIGSGDQEAAHDHLLHIRHYINGKKEPSKGFRAKFRKEARIAEINNTFSIQERRDAFHYLLQNRQPAGVAQAVVDFHFEPAFDVNVREETRSKKPKGGSSASINQVVRSRWLQMATETDQIKYVRLLASKNPSQESLDESLRTAIARSSIPLVTELLQYGANPNTCHRDFQVKVAEGNLDWTKLLLSSSGHQINQEEKDKALLKVVDKSNFDLAHLLLSYGAAASYSSGSSILSAAQKHDFRLLTLLVSTSSKLSAQSLESASRYICGEITSSARCNTFDLLLAAGAQIAPDLLPRLLKVTVDERDIALLSLLVDHKQITAMEATKRMAKLSPTISESDALDLCRLLFKAEAKASEAPRLLYWAVQNDFDRLVALLVHNRVSLDHEEAAAVRFALQQQDIHLLNLLLNGNENAAANSISSRLILAKALPQALRISSQSKRHEAIRLLLQKGVEGEFLDQTLLLVVMAPGICDIVVIQMLLAAGASVNWHGGERNCILQAADDGNFEIVDLLSDPRWGALPNVLSEATVRSYRSRTKSARVIVTNTLSLLLQRGAECNGELIAESLVDAIRTAQNDLDVAVIDTLLQYNVNVNHRDGLCLIEALKCPRPEIFTAICETGNINQKSFAFVLPATIEASRADLLRLRVLLQKCQNFRGVISNALTTEVGRGAEGGQEEIVSILLANGADVSYEKGAVFSKAIKICPFSKSIAYVRLLLASKPDQKALRTAFNSARNISGNIEHRYEMFECILQAGYRGTGISIALNENIFSNKDDLTIPRLFLLHGADVDYDGGLILASAMSSANIKLIDLLLSQNPIESTINRAFKVVCHIPIPEVQKIDIFRCLLATNIVSRELVTYALTNAITNGNTNEAALGLFCRHGAKIEPQPLAALVEWKDLATTRFLLNLLPNTMQARSYAFRSCYDLQRPTRLAFGELLVPGGLESPIWNSALHRAIKDQDADLLELLLKNNLERTPQIDEALSLAADFIDPTIVEILLRYSPSSNAVDEAFRKSLASWNIETTPESVAAATLLLENGISQSLKDRALIKSLEIYSGDLRSLHQVLVQYGANVDVEFCVCFNLAGQLQELDVFQFLLNFSADLNLVVQSLVSNFPQDRYERLLELLPIALRCPQPQIFLPDVGNIFESIRRYPAGNDLIRLLLNCGHPAGGTIRSGDDNTLDTEAVTPLIWALGRSEPWVSDAVILELLSEGDKARPGFATEISQATAIGLAARLGRHNVMQRLIELGVDTSAVDAYGKSPLFYAAAESDIEAVDLLLENRAQCNDGSLHEAARLHSKGIIALLLNRHHDPDYSCDLHEGRTALGELCAYSRIDNGEQASAAYETIKLLINSHADLAFRTKGKTILHFALDNVQPLRIAKELLRFPEIYKDICTDSEMFVYVDDQGRHMSPDIYAERFVKCGEQERFQLVNLLKSKGCKTKWFTKQGDQLPDCKGLPPALKAAMDQQDIADQAERRANQRRINSANLELEISKQRHAASLTQSKEQADLQLFNAQRANDQQIAHDNALSVQRRNNANADHAAEQWHVRERNRIEYDAATARQQLEYKGVKERSDLDYTSQQRMKELEFSSQKKKSEQRYAALEREAGLERRLIESREAAEVRNQTRAMERYSRQDASVKLAAQEQRALLAEAKAARVNAQNAQLALQWDHPD